MGWLDGIGNTLSGIWTATGSALRSLSGQAPPAPPASPPKPEMAKDSSQLAYAQGWEAAAGQMARRSVLSAATGDPILDANAARRQLGTFSAFQQNQGSTNACGTTSLSMIMSWWKNQPGAYTKEMLDPEIRHFNLPSSPYNLIEYARGQGFRAEAKNGATLQDLKQLIDQGIPAQVLINPPKFGVTPSGRYIPDKFTPDDERDLILHYSVVTDYTVNKDGSIDTLIFQDPKAGQFSLKAADFERMWGNLKVGGQESGIHNMLIAVAPSDDTPVSGKDGSVRAAKDIVLPPTQGVSPGAAWFDLVTKGTNAAGRAGNGLFGAIQGAWNGLTSGIASAWKSVFG